MKRILCAAFFAAAALLLIHASPLSARSWDDLYEEDKELFGSEKWEKYPINAFFVEKEKWENHESLMIFWLYKSTEYPKYRAHRLLPFWHHLESKKDNRSLSFIPIALTYWETDGNEEFRINPLFIDYKKNSLTQNSGSYERGSGSLLHFYHYERTAAADSGDTTWWAPIIPLTYHHINRDGGHRNIGWLLDYGWNTAGGEDRITRFWFMPLLFHAPEKYTWILPPLFMHKPGNDGYTHIAPPVFVYNRHDNGEYWIHLFPFFKRSKDIESRYTAAGKFEPEHIDAVKTILGGYTVHHRNSWDGEKTLQKFWFPLIPLLYSYSEYGVESHRNVLWLFDWHNDAQGTTDRFWAAPFVFAEKNSYLHILPPLYMSFQTNIRNEYTHFLFPVYVHYRKTNGEYWQNLLPLYIKQKSIDYRYASKNEYTEEYVDSLKTLIGGYTTHRKVDWNGEKTVQKIWFPFIPLYYSYTEYGVQSHRNLLWLFDWHNDAQGKTDRFWAAPFVFAKKDSYMHVLPPLYMSFSDTDGSTYSHLLPFYLTTASHTARYNAETKKTVSVQNRTVLSPFFGYSRTQAPQEAGQLNEQTIWAPFVPLFYRAWNAQDGFHTNLLWAFDWASDRYGKLERFWVFPFVFIQPGDGGYRHVFPFYFRPAGWSEERGAAYSPLYYHAWSPEEETKWSWLVHYYRNNNLANEYVQIWAPFYFHKETPQYKTTYSALLHYYYDNPGTKWYINTYAPLYFHVKSPSRDTTVTPLWLSTEKTDGTGKFHINLAGIAASTVAGTNPLFSFGGGFNERGIYFDGDVSQFYNLWSVSTRITLPLSKTPFAQDMPESIKEESREAEKIAVSDHTDISRETSTSFFGVELFYGLFAYKQVDTKRHFRLLPLSYLTWDTASDNKIKWVGNYLSYKEGDFEYRVIFPFYGTQRTGKSHREGYLLNAFWSEYDAEKDLTERSLLCPLVNWYSSPDSFGLRILPALTWYKFNTVNDIQYRRYFTFPFVYYSSETAAADNIKRSAFSLSPVHFYSRKNNGGKTSTRWGLNIPLIYYSHNDAAVRFELNPKSGTDNQNAEEGHRGQWTHWLLPFYYMHETYMTGSSGARESDFTLLGLPLLYYHSRSVTASADAAEKKESSLFLMGYYSSFSSGLYATDILLGLYRSHSYPETGDYTYSVMYGLGKISRIKNDFTSYLHPLYYYAHTGGIKNFYVAGGLFHSMRDTAGGNTETSAAWWLFNTTLQRDNSYINGRYLTIDDSMTWLFPVFYHHGKTSAEKDRYRETTTASLLHYYNSERDAEKNVSETTVWAPFLPLAYLHSTPERTHVNIGWLFDIEKSRTQQFTRAWAMPFFFLKTGPDGYFHLLPLYFSAWNDDAKDSMHFIAGLYLHSAPGYDRQNLLYLFDRTHTAADNHTQISLLFSTLQYEISPEVRSMRALWGLLADMEFSRTSSNYDINGMLYLAGMKKHGNDFHSRILPLWYYDRDEYGRTLVIPPLLAYDRHDADDSRYQFWGLGSLWLRWYEPKEKSDFQAALLGIPYYKTQKAERGYESWGSLWGLLWEYEKENETGFNKFSVLKFVYKHVEMNGQTYNSVLGIRL